MFGWANTWSGLKPAHLALHAALKRVPALESYWCCWFRGHGSWDLSQNPIGRVGGRLGDRNGASGYCPRDPCRHSCVPRTVRTSNCKLHLYWAVLRLLPHSLLSDNTHPKLQESEPIVIMITRQNANGQKGPATFTKRGKVCGRVGSLTWIGRSPRIPVHSGQVFGYMDKQHT